MNPRGPLSRPIYEVGHPVILAHRGGMAEAPEHTREAFESALALGVRAVEIDVRHTVDGVPVLAHDETLVRRFGDPRDVSAVAWDELAQLRDVDGSAPMKLADLLAEFPEFVVNIDAKTDEVVGALLRDVREAGAANRVLLTAFSSRRIATLGRVTRGQTMLGLGMGDVARMLAWAHLPGRAAALASVERFADASRAIQVPLSFRGVPVATRRFVDAAHSAGHVVHVWTVNEPDEMDRLLDLGVDGLVTDVPSVAVDVWRSRNLPLR